MRALSTPPVDGPVRGPSISLKNACIPRPQQKATQEPAQSTSASSRGLGPHRAEVDRPARQNSDNTAGREECRDLPLNSTVRAKRCRMQKCMRSEPNAFCFRSHNQVLSQRRSLRFILCVQDASRIISRDREVFSLMPETAALHAGNGSSAPQRTEHKHYYIAPCRKRQLSMFGPVTPMTSGTLRAQLSKDGNVRAVGRASPYIPICLRHPTR